jgi:hypothetical protein
VQPTDLVSGRFSCLEEGHGDREEDERGSAEQHQAVLERANAMKALVFRIAVTLSGVLAVALAGGATLKAF